MTINDANPETLSRSRDHRERRLYVALAADDLREAIIAAVNHSGDSDSIGAITGYIVGAAYGAALLQATWAQQVELRDVIEALATDFAGLLEGDVDPETLWSRYPGW
jgi:hypothetical protein